MVIDMAKSKTKKSRTKILPNIRGQLNTDVGKPEILGFFKKRKSIYEQLHRG